MHEDKERLSDEHPFEPARLEGLLFASGSRGPSARGPWTLWPPRPSPYLGRMTRPAPRCPLRPEDFCTLCHPGATGPEDCGLVWLVMSDPGLRERLAELRREERAGRRSATVTTTADYR